MSQKSQLTAILSMRITGCATEKRGGEKRLLNFECTEQGKKTNFQAVLDCWSGLYRVAWSIFDCLLQDTVIYLDDPPSLLVSISGKGTHVGLRATIERSYNAPITFVRLSSRRSGRSCPQLRATLSPAHTLSLTCLGEQVLGCAFCEQERTSRSSPSYCWIAESNHFPFWYRINVQTSLDSVGVSSLPSTR